jgi:hypothetical protein
LRGWRLFPVLADTIPTEAAPVFAGFEGRGFLLHELWIELWTAFAESAVIESPVRTVTSRAETKSYGFSGQNSRPPKTAESGASSVVVVFSHIMFFIDPSRSLLTRRVFGIRQ